MNFESFVSSTEKVKGLGSYQYQVKLKFVKSVLSDAEQTNIVISPVLVLDENLKKAMYFSAKTIILETTNSHVTLSFTLAEPYLRKFFEKIKDVEGATIIQRSTE
jgi:hypothetical protein